MCTTEAIKSIKPYQSCQFHSTYSVSLLNFTFPEQFDILLLGNSCWTSLICVVAAAAVVVRVKASMMRCEVLGR